jgi:choline dehydrogenase
VTYIDETRTRVSSESAYFTKDVLARSNLKVVINATVTQIITEKVGDEVKAIGVEFTRNATGFRYRVKSKRDIVVS